ncbi:hypothetical protein F4777DRAFT_381534 [Nemania sp. FL0916]|nr:hypothetical protein F4777DRAFT_381534 [Nemania sp. FL0916]
MEHIDPQLLAMSGFTEGNDAFMSNDTIMHDVGPEFCYPSPPTYPQAFPSYPACAPYPDFTTAYPEVPLNPYPSGQQHFFPPPFPWYPDFSAQEYPPISFEQKLTPPPSEGSRESSVQDSIVVAGSEEAKQRKGLRRSRRRGPSKRANKQRYSQEVEKALLPGEKLQKPLSQLAKNHPEIPKFDINAFVRRSAKERQTYTAKKVGRPLNAFILYRKTYQDHAKHILKGNDNQALSRCIGASYRMEDQAVKDKFARYAQIEKEFHKAAFPNYAFHPKSRGEKSDKDDKYYRY